MKALSLHIGLNFVDPRHYDGWNGELAACEFDAKDMTAIAKARGFTPQTLLRGKATAKAVITAIGAAATKLRAGDIFLVSYAGHGGQVPDVNGDEGKFGDARDRMDETWCLFDRELIDDELAALWAKFAKGVRILVISDSCHSGSVTRAARRPAGRFRGMPSRQADLVYRKNQGLYDAIQNSLTGAEQAKIAATVILISGCMDNQLSRDGDHNGLFTETLKSVLADPGFAGGYRKFRNVIASLMPIDQTPNYFVSGAANPAFEKEFPFTTAAGRANGKAKPAAKKAAVRKAIVRDKPLEAVLQSLDALGYRDPRDEGSAREDSKIKTWFGRTDKQDKAAALPEPQRVAQFIEKMKRSLNVKLTPAALTGGKYATPRQIADLA